MHFAWASKLMSQVTRKNQSCFSQIVMQVIQMKSQLNIQYALTSSISNNGAQIPLNFFIPLVGFRQANPNAQWSMHTLLLHWLIVIIDVNVSLAYEGLPSAF